MSFPYFSFFIGDLPGEPTSIFALARGLAANADSIGDVGKAINALDAVAFTWTGASFVRLIYAGAIESSVHVFLGGTKGAKKPMRKH